MGILWSWNKADSCYNNSYNGLGAGVLVGAGAVVTELMHIPEPLCLSSLLGVVGLLLFLVSLLASRASQVVLVVKNPLVTAGDTRGMGSIPESGSPGGGHGNHSSILAWRIPWSEEPGGLQSIGL